jgi:uncharacterized protein YqhQ
VKAEAVPVLLYLRVISFSREIRRVFPYQGEVGLCAVTRVLTLENGSRPESTG